MSAGRLLIYCDVVGGVAGGSDDHLGVLMFAAAAGTLGSGRYADGQWEVSTGGRATDAGSRMVTLHKIMHAETKRLHRLGSLFHAYAALVQHAPAPGVYREASLSVIEACRRTHEVFATYTGAFLADRTAARSLLVGRPEYSLTTLTHARSPRGWFAAPGWSDARSSARSGAACRAVGCLKPCGSDWRTSGWPTFAPGTCQISGWTCSSKRAERTESATALLRKTTLVFFGQLRCQPAGCSGRRAAGGVAIWHRDCHGEPWHLSRV